MTNAEITKAINDFGQRIEALETMHNDGNVMSNHLIPVEPKPSQPELAKGFWYIDTIANANRLFKYDGFFDDIRSPLYIRPATLDDLAIDMGGVKVWMVERDNCNHINLYQYDGQYRLIASFYHTYLEIPIARAIADAMHVPIITEAQWELLTKEAGK